MLTHTIPDAIPEASQPAVSSTPPIHSQPSTAITDTKNNEYKELFANLNNIPTKDLEKHLTEFFRNLLQVTSHLTDSDRKPISNEERKLRAAAFINEKIGYMPLTQQKDVKPLDFILSLESVLFTAATFDTSLFRSLARGMTIKVLVVRLRKLIDKGEVILLPFINLLVQLKNNTNYPPVLFTNLIATHILLTTRLKEIVDKFLTLGNSVFDNGYPMFTFLRQHNDAFAAVYDSYQQLKNYLKKLKKAGIPKDFYAPLEKEAAEIEKSLIIPLGEIITVLKNCNTLYNLFSHRLKEYDKRGLAKTNEAYSLRFSTSIYKYKVERCDAKTLLTAINRITASDDEPSPLLAILGKDLPEKVIDHCAKLIVECITTMTKSPAELGLETASMETFIFLCKQEQRINTLIFYLNHLVKVNKKSGTLEEITKLEPENLMEIVKDTTKSFDEVEALDRARRKALEQERRIQERNREEKLLIIASTNFTNQLQAENEKNKKETEKNKMLENFKTLDSSTKQRYLIDLLDPSNKKQDSYESTALISALGELGIKADPTTKGSQVNIGGQILSFHREHNGKKLAPQFISDLRKAFENLGITMELLNEEFDLIHAIGIQNRQSSFS